MSMEKFGDSDSLEFWQRHKSTIPKLANPAINVLQTPASSASIERVFSAAALSVGTKKRRSMLSYTKIEQETMLRVNQHILEF